MNIKCIKEMDGFTVSNTYPLLGCAGEYVQLKDDNGKVFILNEGYFIVNDTIKPTLPKCPEPMKVFKTLNGKESYWFFGWHKWKLK